MSERSFLPLQIVSQIILYTIYERTFTESVWQISDDEVHRLLSDSMTLGQVNMAVELLMSQSLLALRVGGDYRERRCYIPAAGINHLEELLKDPESIPSVYRDKGIAAFDGERRNIATRVPASDRVVEIDHNSAEVQAITQSAGELREQLVSGNDLGSLSAEEAKAAAAEIDQLVVAFAGDAVRPGIIFERARTTLGWVAAKAAEAAVGAMAVGLLALIANFLGFPL